MRKIVIFLMLLFFSINFIYSQDTEHLANASNDKLLKEQKMFLNMMISGIILTSIGSVALTAGLTLDTIIMIDPTILPLTYLISYSNTIHNRTYNYNMYFNPISFSLDISGITMLAVGIPLLAVGGANYRKIKSKLMSEIINHKIKPELAYNLSYNTFILGASFSF